MAYNLVDPNHAQSQVQRIRTLRRTIVLGLIAAGFATFLFPLIFISGRVNDDISRTESELSAVRDQISMAALPAPEVQGILNEVAEVESLISALSAVSNTLGVQWTAVASAIATYDHEQIALRSLTQNGRTLLLSGRSADNLVIAEYASQLAASTAFADVEISAIQLTDPVPDTSPAAPATEDGQTPADGTPEGASPPQNPLPFEFTILLTVREPQP